MTGPRFWLKPLLPALLAEETLLRARAEPARYRGLAIEATAATAREVDLGDLPAKMREALAYQPPGQNLQRHVVTRAGASSVPRCTVTCRAGSDEGAEPSLLPPRGPCALTAPARPAGAAGRDGRGVPARHLPGDRHTSGDCPGGRARQRGRDGERGARGAGVGDRATPTGNSAPRRASAVRGSRTAPHCDRSPCGVDGRGTGAGVMDLFVATNVEVWGRLIRKRARSGARIRRGPALRIC